MQPVQVNAEGVVERIRHLLLRAAENQGVPLPAPAESLYKSGVLDSFGMLEFLTTVEEELSVKIPDEDLVPSNFETIEKISTYFRTRWRQ